MKARFDRRARVWVMTSCGLATQGETPREARAAWREALALLTRLALRSARMNADQIAADAIRRTVASQRLSGIDARSHFSDDPRADAIAREYAERLDAIEKMERGER